MEVSLIPGSVLQGESMRYAEPLANSISTAKVANTQTVTAGSEDPYVLFIAENLLQKGSLSVSNVE